MLTPWTVVEVVHAVQRPLRLPSSTCSAFTTARSDRPRHVRCFTPVAASTPPIASISTASGTSRSTIRRGGSASGPIDRHRHDAAFQVKVTSPKIYADTKAGGVAGGWPEHSLIAPDVVGINTPQDERVPVKAHEFHDTRYRRIEYWLDATTRFREFLPPDLLTKTENRTRVPTDAHIKVTGARQVTWIPNAAPPPRRMSCMSCRSSGGLVRSTSAACSPAGGEAAGFASISIADGTRQAMARCSASCCRRKGSPTTRTRRHRALRTRNTSRNGATIRCGIPRSCRASPPRSRTSRSRVLHPTLPERGCRQTRRRKSAISRPVDFA